MIAGFRREDQKCTLLGYYAESSGNFLPTFRDDLSVSGFKNSWTLKMETMSSRNVGKKLPLLAAY